MSKFLDEMMSLWDQIDEKLDERIKKANEGDLDAIYDVAIFFSLNGDIDGAEEYFNKWEEKEPNSAELYYNRGLMYYTELSHDIEHDEYWENKLDENEYASLAIDNFLKAIELDDKFIEAYNNLARVYLLLEMTDDAKKYLDKSLEIKPEQEEVKELLEDFFEEE